MNDFTDWLVLCSILWSFATFPAAVFYCIRQAFNDNPLFQDICRAIALYGLAVIFGLALHWSQK